MKKYLVRFQGKSKEQQASTQAVAISRALPGLMKGTRIGPSAVVITVSCEYLGEVNAKKTE